MKNIVILIIVLISNFKVLAHPTYVSITELNHNPTEKTLEVSIKIFYDDLKRALPKIDIESTDSTTVQNSYDKIAKYIASNFSISGNQSTQNKDIIGFELEGNELYIYLEYKGYEKVNSLEIKNTILTEIFEEQNNIIHCKVNGIQKSTILNKTKPIAVLDLLP